MPEGAANYTRRRFGLTRALLYLVPTILVLLWTVRMPVGVNEIGYGRYQTQRQPTLDEIGWRAGAAILGSLVVVAVVELTHALRQSGSKRGGQTGRRRGWLIVCCVAAAILLELVAALFYINVLGGVLGSLSGEFLLPPEVTIVYAVIATVLWRIASVIRARTGPVYKAPVKRPPPSVGARFSVTTLLVFFVLLSLVMFWMMHVPVVEQGYKARPPTAMELARRAGAAFAGSAALALIFGWMEGARKRAIARQASVDSSSPTYGPLLPMAVILIGLGFIGAVAVTIPAVAAAQGFAVSPELLLGIAVVTAGVLALGNVLQYWQPEAEPAATGSPVARSTSDPASPAGRSSDR